MENHMNQSQATEEKRFPIELIIVLALIVIGLVAISFKFLGII